MHGIRAGLGFSFLLSALISAGCGGGDQPPPATPTPADTTAPTPTAPATAPTPTAAADADAGAAATPATAPTPTPGGPWPFGGYDDRNAQLDRLKKDAGPIKTNWTPPGKSDRYGHAEGLINAPPDQVKAKLTDYPHFSELAGPKFKSVKVVDKKGPNTDVYFQLPIMKGAVVIWYVTEFAPPKAVGNDNVIEGTFVKGNIKGMNIAWTIRPGADDKSTIMTCDLLLQPTVPAPQSALDEELRDACGDAINSVKKKVAP